MLGVCESAECDKAGVLTVLAGVMLCLLAAGLPVLLMPQSGRCAKAHVESFCDDVVALLGAAPDHGERP